MASMSISYEHALFILIFYAFDEDVGTDLVGFFAVTVVVGEVDIKSCGV
jgi:hypothetical protein